MFELKINSEVIPLRWGTYAMKLFCDRSGQTIDDFFDIVQRMALVAAGEQSNKPLTSQEIFSFVENLIHAGYKSQHKKDVENETVCDWIDQAGGFGSIEKGPVMEYVNHVLRVTFNGVTPLPGEQPQEKKSESEPGTIS